MTNFSYTAELKDKLLEHSRSETVELDQKEYAAWIESSILKKFEYGVTKLDGVKKALAAMKAAGKIDEAQSNTLQSDIDDATYVFGSLLWQDDNPAIWLGNSNDLDPTPAANWTTGPQSGRTMKRVVAKA